MPLVGFEPTISAGDRLQTHTLDLEVTGKHEVFLLHYSMQILVNKWTLVCPGVGGASEYVTVTKTADSSRTV